MPRRQRSNVSRRAALSSNAQAWLRGDKSCGFFKFKSQEELSALWNRFGDHEKMWWRSRYCLPVTLEELAAHEDAWLNGGDDEGYIFHFIGNAYTDDEKQKLWNERGDKAGYRWSPGMRRPEAI